MKTIVVIIIIVFYCGITYGQDSVVKKKIYKTWLSLENDTKLKGILYQVTDSSLIVSKSLVVSGRLSQSLNLEEIHFRDINFIYTKKKNATGNGALIGAGAGLLLGVVIGLSSGDDSGGFISFSAEEKAMMTGSALAILGAGLGALVGSVKMTIPINGNHTKFNLNKGKLKAYSYCDY